MSLRFVESFEPDGSAPGGPQQAVAKWTIGSCQFVAGRNGQGVNNKDLMVALSPGANWSIGLATMSPGPGGAPLNWQGNIYSLAAPQTPFGGLPVSLFELNVMADGTLGMFAGSNLIANPSVYTFSASVWAAIGIDIALSTVSVLGIPTVFVTAKLYVNSVLIASAGVASNIQVSTLLSGLSEGNMHQFGNFGTFPGNTIDDVFILDNVTLAGANPNAQYTDVGDVAIFAIYPRADVQNDWTPLTGPNRFSMVNEHPPDGDTTYIWDDTVNDVQTFLFDLVASFTGQIKGMQLSIYARKDDEGERAIVDAGNSGSYVGTKTFPLGDSYRYALYPYDVDPITGNLLTPTLINGSDYGAKLVA